MNLMSNIVIYGIAFQVYKHDNGCGKTSKYK